MPRKPRYKLDPSLTANPDVARLAQTINGGASCISITTHEENYALEVIREAVITLGREMLLWSAGYGVRNGLFAAEPAEPKTETAVAGLCHMVTENALPVCVTLDLVDHLKNELTQRILRDCIDRIAMNNSVLILVDHSDCLPEVIKAYAVSFELSLPDEEELETILRSTLQHVHRKNPIEVGITKKGLQAVVKNLRGLSRRQARQLIQDCVAHDKRFDDNDVNRILAGKRRLLQADGLLTYVQTPLDLDEIGGMENLKRWLRTRQNAFAPEAAEFGLRPPRGILMLGVQGAGKSLCAKAVATAWRQPLLRLDPGNLYNSFVGQSEQNLRRALQQTEMMSPVVLWIDEVEKAFASAAAQSTDGGLSKRMFGTLLTWMQEHEAPVFLVATANDIAALPPELLRKGRFDEIFFVGLPAVPARRKIFEIHLKKRNRNPENFDLDLLAEVSHGYSGAEIEQAIVSALHEAYANETQPDTEMVRRALRDSPPLSVTMAEHIENLHRWAEGRCVPAD